MSGPAPLDAALLRAHPLPALGRESDKDERGRVLVVGGSAEVPGAALLSAQAALRAGAGRLRMAAPQGVSGPLAIAMPEARVFGLAEAGGGIEAAAGERLAEIAAHVDAVLLGPGMLDERSAAALARALLEAEGDFTLILDASALTGLTDGVEHVRRRAGQVIVTPHAGEMARLMGCDRSAILADPAGTAREAAARLQAVVVLKGGQTHVASPDGATWLFTGGSVGLGTSGSGDVLAGLITGVAARGAPPVRAAQWGVYLHGEAGARLAQRMGPVGFLARELAGEVPPLLAELSR